MKRNIMLLSLYWIIASACFVWVPSVFGKVDLLIIIESIGWIILALISMILIVYFFHNRSFLILFLPIIIPLIYFVRVISLTNMVYLRSAFCAFLTIAFILSFLFFLYFEKEKDISRKHIILVHRRYLEYLRSFIWISMFLLVAYLAWELNAVGRFEELSAPSHFPLIIGLIQLISVFSFGVCLVFYAFHVRLQEIEQIANTKK